jgi:hypothetical protein
MLAPMMALLVVGLFTFNRVICARIFISIVPGGSIRGALFMR